MSKEKYDIILASASPRRKEIMQKMGFDFEIKVSGLEEKTTETEPSLIVRELATIKAKDVASGSCGERNIVIGADTVVAHHGEIMGKPKDESQAFDMIKSYEGDIHRVYTGVCLVIPFEENSEYDELIEKVKDFEARADSFYGLENLRFENVTMEKTTTDGICANTVSSVNAGLSAGGRKCAVVSYSVYTNVHVVPMSDDEIMKYATSGEPLDKAGAYAIQGGFAPFISAIEGDYYNVVGLPACSLYALIKTIM